MSTLVAVAYGRHIDEFRRDPDDLHLAGALTDRLDRGLDRAG